MTRQTFEILFNQWVGLQGRYSLLDADYYYTYTTFHPHPRSKFWVESLFAQMYAFELPLPDDGYLSS